MQTCQWHAYLIVGQPSSPYCEDTWRRYCYLASFLRLSIHHYLVLTTETLAKLLAFVNCCYCQSIVVGNDYTDKLICREYVE